MMSSIVSSSPPTITAPLPASPGRKRFGLLVNLASLDSAGEPNHRAVTQLPMIQVGSIATSEYMIFSRHDMAKYTPMLCYTH